MENKYREYKGFCYKYIYDRNMWRISMDEDDSKCSVWLFDCGKYSLNEAIDKILNDPDFTTGIKMGYEIPSQSFIDFFKPMQIAFNKRMAGVNLTQEEKILLDGK